MGANSSDDHEHQLQVVGSADNDIDHHHQQQQQQHVVINSMIIRYKCSYCGRGFSNAQALGGHMNVHRRDRAAKFINNNNNNASSSDHSSTHHQSQLLPWISTTTKLDQERQELADDDDIHVRLHQRHKPQHQLPLFVDTVVVPLPPSRLICCKGGNEGDLKEDDHDEVVIDTKRELMMHQPSTCSSHGHDNLVAAAAGEDSKLVMDTKRESMMHQPSTSSHGHVDLADEDSKLDLELRLGPPDPDDRTGTMSTTTTSTTTGIRDFF